MTGPSARGRPSVWRPTPADPDELFGADELDRARRYQRPLRRARVVRAVGAARCQHRFADRVDRATGRGAGRAVYLDIEA